MSETTRQAFVKGVVYLLAGLTMLFAAPWLASHGMIDSIARVGMLAGGGLFTVAGVFMLVLVLITAVMLTLRRNRL